jgi:hypothetical protein
VANELVLTYLPWLENRLESVRLGVYYNINNIISCSEYIYSSDRCQMSRLVSEIYWQENMVIRHSMLVLGYGLRLSKMRPEDRLYCRCGAALFRADRYCLTFFDSFFIA